MFEHDADEGDDVKTFEGLRQSLVVFDEASEAGGPGEGSLDHPSTRQQHKARAKKDARPILLKHARRLAEEEEGLAFDVAPYFENLEALPIQRLQAQQR